MRIDKLTTKFQEALGDAQSLALAKDNQFIEPEHLLLAMFRQQDGGTRSLLTRAGVNVTGLEKLAEAMINKLPQFDLSLDKIICPTKDCNQQRTISITHTIDRTTRQIIGAIVSLQCCECYSPQENICIVNYSQ